MLFVQPIENLWAIIKRKLHLITCNSKADLNARIQEIWSQDEEIQDACGKLVEGMPRRISACISAKGGVTKY